MGTQGHERMLTTLNPPYRRASDGNAGTRTDAYYFGAALLKSSLWERRDTNRCLWERRDIRIDACRGNALQNEAKSLSDCILVQIQLLT